ncbi:MAG TPA: 6-phospho-beta-glucosidase [Propionibacteriaceae bacterium]|nr:6-phospho-beta-glucosidase [Propionibacteriaceae bacterium]
MKVTVVGGGSTYTPELADGIARLKHLFGVDELALTDPAEKRLALVAGVSQRIFAKYGYSGQITFTTDLDRAVSDAAVVLLQLRVGGQAARAVDESLPLRCGCVGQETTGAGGLAKALRTVPVILQIAERVSQLAAKDAWIIDFTNPVGIVTRALLDHDHRAVGLCNVAIGNQRVAANLLGVEPARVRLDHVGLNHLTWTRRVLIDEQDQLPQLLATAAEELAGRSGMPAELLRRLAVWPSYYLRYFYEHDQVVEQQRAKPSRAEEVAEIERQLLEIYADPAVDEKPGLLQQRGGAYYSEAAVDLMASLLTDRGDVQVVNLRNEGTLPFLADHAVVEVPARIGRQGPIPQTSAPVDPLFAGLIAHVSAYEELALDAAIRGGRERVFRALLAHPLIGQYDLADKLTGMLIAANRDHLPWAA